MSFDKNIIHADGKKAIIYLRVSTEEQVDNFSLGSQEEICRKEAGKRGYEIIDVFREEGRSAKTILGRPVLINLLEYCRKNKNKIQALFVYRIDRISRQTSDYLAIRKKLLENGVSVISSTEPTGDSPTEKLVETILAGFAQLDNDIRSERSRNGLRARFLSGKIVTGSVPLGYIVQAGYAIKDPTTWDNVKRAWELMVTGTKSLQDMAEIMNKWGLRHIRSKKEILLIRQRVQEIFRSKFYMGVLSSKTYPEEVKGQHVPMITEEQFYRVQALLDGRNPNKVALARRNHANTDFPLRRIIRCSKCGMGLTAGWSKGRHAKYGYYRCGKPCNNASIKVDDLDNSLINVLKEVTPKPKCLNLFLNFLYKIYHERFSRLQKIKNKAEDEIARLKDLRQQLVKKNLDGVYSDEIFREQNSTIEDQILQAQILKEDATIEKYNIDAITTFMKTVLADLGEAYKRSDLNQAKVLLGSMFPSGLAWSYNGILNHQISPLYQYIRTFNKDTVLSCAQERS